MSPTLASTRPLRVVRLKRLIEKIGVSRSTIYNKINPKSPYFDASFPKPISLGPSSIGWIESQVDAWIVKKNGDSALSTES